MANSANIEKKKIILDTFTSAISVRSLLGETYILHPKKKIHIQNIEWEKPTTVGHTATITDEDGDTLFSEECVTAKQSMVNRFPYKKSVQDILIAISGVQSGSIKIFLA